MFIFLGVCVCVGIRGWDSSHIHLTHSWGMCLHRAMWLKAEAACAVLWSPCSGGGGGRTGVCCKVAERQTQQPHTHTEHNLPSGDSELAGSPPGRLPDLSMDAVNAWERRPSTVMSVRHVSGRTFTCGHNGGTEQLDWRQVYPFGLQWQLVFKF